MTFSRQTCLKLYSFQMSKNRLDWESICVCRILNSIWRRLSELKVHFTNILRAAFLYESFARSFFVLAVNVKLFIGAIILAQIKCWWNWLMMGSISSTFAREFFGARFNAFFWWTAFSECRTNFGNFWPNFSLTALLLRLNCEFFCQTPCAGNFSLGEKVWSRKLVLKSHIKLSKGSSTITSSILWLHLPVTLKNLTSSPKSHT